MPRLPAKKNKSRLNLDLSELARKNLENLQLETDADSLSEVIRHSLNLYEVMVNAKKKGSTVIIRSKNGKEQLVEFI